VSVLDFLLFLKGWHHNSIEKTNSRLTKGVRAPFYTKPFQEGWITSAFYVSNDRDVEFEVHVLERATGLERRLTVKPSAINALGIINPNNLWPWVSVYDTVANNYVIVYAPVRPWSYRGKIEVTALLPEDAVSDTATVSVVINQVIIDDKPLFERTWRALHVWGRWAPIFNLVGHVPIVEKLEELFAEKE